MDRERIKVWKGRISILIVLCLFGIIAGIYAKVFILYWKENHNIQRVFGATYMTMNNDFSKVVDNQIRTQVEKRGDHLISLDPALDQKKQNAQIKIIILTTFDDDEFVFSALKHGASGYLLKGISMDELEQAIHTVHAGGAMINPDVATKVVDFFSEMAQSNYDVMIQPENISDITDAEWDIIKLVGRGMSNKEIAQHLKLSEGTVRNYLSTILSKLNLRDRFPFSKRCRKRILKSSESVRFCISRVSDSSFRTVLLVADGKEKSITGCYYADFSCDRFHRCYGWIL